MITDAEFKDWLESSTALRVTLVEAVASVGGSDVTRYMSTKAYSTSSSEAPPNTIYLPIISTGIKFTEQISVETKSASLSFGDIELNNTDGAYDSWLSDIWYNKPLKAWIGDVRWPRSDFRLIFDGVVSDIDSKSRERLNLKLRDKMQRLNTALTENKLGGTTPNKDSILPLVFGECHNISPLLANPVTNDYQVSQTTPEQVIEVRVNGVPVSYTGSVGNFTLANQPFGTVTASVQGYKYSGTYYNDIANLIKVITTNFGKVTDRLIPSDLDLTNLAAFSSAHPQPVGLYIKDRVNVVTACQQLANSLGAQVIMTRDGKLRIIQVAFPPAGTPTVVQQHQYSEKSLKISGRTQVVGAVKLGYCKNWTIQDSLQTNIPAQHIDLYAQEWLTATATDSTTINNYKLSSDPVQEDTLLLVQSDAQTEAQRRLDLFKIPRTTYTFEGFASCLTLELGQAITIFNSRFDLQNGKTGMVTSLAPDWMTGRVTVGVTI